MTDRSTAFQLRRRLLLGVVHLAPLPGSPRFESRGKVLDGALFDAHALIEGGVDGFVLENFGDAPFFAERVPASTVAEMAALAERLRRAVGAEPLIGVNVLRNDAAAALAIAAATGCDFIRVNVHTGVMLSDQGTLEGRAAETLRCRRELEAPVAIAADVGVKHALAPAGFDLSRAAKDCASRGLADALIVTGTGTGAEADLAHLEAVRGAVPDRPLWVGSGVTPQTVAAVFAVADGAIVGTSLKEDGDVSKPVSAARVRALVARAQC